MASHLTKIDSPWQSAPRDITVYTEFPLWQAVMWADCLDALHTTRCKPGSWWGEGGARENLRRPGENISSSHFGTGIEITTVMPAGPKLTATIRLSPCLAGSRRCVCVKIRQSTWSIHTRHCRPFLKLAAFRHGEESCTKVARMNYVRPWQRRGMRYWAAAQTHGTQPECAGRLSASQPEPSNLELHKA